MAERYERCRYWPDCMIHAGEPVPHRAQAEIGQAEREQIVAEYAAGDRRVDIAAKHEITYNVAFRITNGMPARRAETDAR